ncbi:MULTISPECIES: tautomerase family protein [unclassified Leisingera]|uniref:tautomerase family protein n=1 Tax=unclassified Leisingera TaxID=2614906 RepID=UPI000315DC55|nr:MULTISPECIES: tautomerase family protein [unclassified Leisingera]KIC16788.1 4-oxalocrotonate tautomerase [Leisingera sp. ANG-DT]KIC25686.1 4-oxalocrotonate tautomerase [Leisingera sp. ANG-S3]KIC34461.1 4-oxalocrotonate tautomerase [Leisingera sp. ANG-S5]KIC54210.1 4-oxalocrotonate tautomerase [Leisingera sp. ANG-S]KID10969.1 4-oxalocrotonate tautomerase [Leisingera sp. ANG1]
MPLIDIHVLEGVFTEEEKHQLIRETAKAFGTVAGQVMQDNTSVRIHEVRSGHWGGADTVWTTEKALALKHGG